MQAIPDLTEATRFQIGDLDKTTGAQRGEATRGIMHFRPANG